MLSAASAEVVRATLPVVRDHAVEITGVFYPSMFAAHPELLDLFNQGNQASGQQRVALASAVVAFAEHLLDPAAPFGPIAKRIAHKHVSLGIRAEQYPIVARHLMAAVGTVLGDDSLLRRGVPADRIHYEVFGPGVVDRTNGSPA